MAIKLVSFYYGSQSDFQSLTSLIDGALYFIEDTGRIYRGSLDELSGLVNAIDVTNDVIIINDLPQVGVSNKIYIKYRSADASTAEPAGWDALFWNSSTAQYESIIHHLTPNEVLAKYEASTVIDNLQSTHPVAMLPSERTKLSGIQSGAEVNVQSDWNETNSSSDAFIKNKPVITSNSADIVDGGTKIPNSNAVYQKLQGYIPSSGSEAASTVKTLYESNVDTNAFTDADKTKLAGIAAGAEVNVQSDWDQTNTSADDYIKHKPTADKSTLSPLELTDSDLFYPTSKFMKNYLATNYLLRSNGHLTGPMFADSNNIYLGSTNTTPYIRHNSVTGAIEFFTA